MPQTRKSDKIANSGENVHIEETKKKEIHYKNVEAKIGKESISAEELAVYLSRKRELSDGDMSEKTIRRYIKKLCRMSKGLLKDSDFKDGNETNSPYLFKPEYHGLLLSFLDTEYFGGKKNDQKLSERIVLHEQIAENVSKYLEPDMQKDIMEDPSYLNALVEGRLSKRINNELAGLINTMYNSEPVMRYQFMIECLDRLVAIRRWMNEWEERIKLIRCMFAKDDEDSVKQEGVEDDLFKYDMLDSLMIKLIYSKVHNKEYKYVSDNELLSYPTAYMAMKLYDITGLKDHEIYMILNQIEEKVSNDCRYRNIMEKAHLLLDSHDYLEGKILDSLDKIVKSQIVSNEADIFPADFNRLIRFIETAVQADKAAIKDILGDTYTDVVLDKRTIDEIMKVKDRIEKQKLSDTSNK
ncbi:hypothetical protein [Clostridium paridis]|uniref:Uncharacterized protein n=1 Tax=Clostridium paridis TaxID=2803863 RepID=A0A937FJM1_9CLOT|nr:hypothetical protein [Clostridium paridis]MBL4933031.1 hypothetical protein [Clostridium paridis]